VKIGIVGCGLIGKRRALIAQQSPDDEVVIVADVDKSRAEAVATENGCLAATEWQEIINSEDVEAVVVATPNKYLMPVAVAALQHGKHVLVEKPPGRNYHETEQMVVAAKKAGRVLKVGFNHRHHPAIWKAHELCARGELGKLMYIRAVYGHGGRPGYDKEWRADADLSGGGELLDQGVHIVDLCRWFLGDFCEVAGFVSTYYWDLGFFAEAHHCEERSSRRSNLLHDKQKIASLRSRYGKKALPTRPPLAMTPLNRNLQLEDNAFAILRTSQGQVAQFHTSWTQWKNQFAFEVVGRDGYVRVNGLGGSYGVETLTVGHRRPESGPPIEGRFEFPGPDLSWQAEWQEFTAAIREGRQPLANGEDGLRTMRTIAAIYESASTGQVVRL